MPNDLRKNLVIFIIISCIILININVYAAASVTLKSITYNGKTLSFYADCIKFHVKANGYSNKLKDEMDNNLYTYASPGPGRELQPTNAKMQGYGNYVFKEDTSLFDFIQFCYLKDPGMTAACSIYNGANELSSCDYTKLCTFSGQNLNNYSKLFVDNFWNNMTSFLGETFNSFQDLYFYDKYTNKGASLVFSQNRLASNGKEFLTCMMSYIFSNNQNSAHNLQIKKGDIVPFLYVKEHIDDTDIKNDPREIAKFAYLACIEGWAETTSNDLWFEEYEAVYGVYDEEELCDLVGEDLDTLAMWYTETDEKYQMQKGNKGNPLLGSTIDKIIKSDYSITQQLEATDHYLQNIEGIGDYKENMARNELMAKYMMENSHIGDTIKDYNVGITFITENLQRGTSETKNTKTAILSDFQVLEFDHALNKDGHSDDDGISDLTELTNNTKWVNITGPATRTYNDAVSNGTTTKSLEATFQDYEDKSPGVVKYEDGKLYYKTYNYNSNPMLNDTDFDGMNDNIDGNKTDGTFKTSSNPIGRVEWTNDFRYFFIDNDKYNDELSTMSLMLCNLADGNSISGSDASGNINTYLNKMGFTNVSRKNTFKISPIESIGGNLYIGKKTIQVGANKKSVKRYKDVYGIFLGGFDTENNYKKLVTNFNTDEIETYYENISIDINDFIDNYIGLNPNGEDFCYWICGYSIAGGIASHVSPYLVGKGETYAYTFGAPNTTKGGSTSNANIKNIINEDDVIPKIINKDEGYGKVGTLYNDSIFDNLKKEYRELVGNVKNYEAYPKRANTVKKAIKDIKSKETTMTLKERALTLLSKYLNNYEYIHDEMTMSAYPEMSTYLNPSVKKVKDGHSIKSYYVLAKSLNGFDLNNEDSGWNELDTNVDSDEERNENDVDIIEDIRNLADWYVNHIPTYQHRYANYNNETGSISRNQYTNATQEARDYFENNGGSIIEKHDGPGRRTDPITHAEVTFTYDYLYPAVAEDNTGTNEILHISNNRIGYRNEELVELANNRNDQVGATQYAGYGGDDCNSFAMGVIRLDAEGDRGQNTNGSNRLTSTGMQLQNTSSDMMQTNDNFEAAMMNLGFDKYAYRGGRWVKFVNNNGTIIQRPLTEVMGDNNFTMSINFLEPGDMLVKNGHVEFYLGYINAHRNDAQSEDDYEWMSVNDLTPEYREYNDYMTENSQTHIVTDNRQTRAYSTFGWGRVHNQSPEGGNYFSYSGHSFSLGSDSGYDVIFRKDR